MRVLILIAFFVSGACALVYEVVWTRLLGLVMGNTVYAVSTTLAAFMAGLAVGSYVFGRVADRLERPGRFYAILELLIGVYCLAIPLLIAGVDPLYSFAYRKLSTSFGVMTGVRFLTAGLILVVPAALMGATLPVLSRFYASHKDRLGWEIGRLYAINTWGAVCGTLLAGFVLLPVVGVRSSLGAAAAANIALGLLVFAATRGERKRAPSPASIEMTPAGGDEAEPPDTGTAAGAASGASGSPFVTVALVFAVSGMAALIYEVAWTRIISLLIGPSTYAFTLMLACFLVGLALGSALAARWIDRWQDKSLKVMGLLLMATGACALGLLPALAGSVPLVREITRRYSDSFTPLYVSYFGLVALLLMPPTVALGAVFPAAVRAALPGIQSVGTRVGKLYCANTIGAILGSVFAGFALIPVLGLEKTVAVGAACHLAAACFLFLKGKDIRFAGIAVAVGIVGLALLPHWDVRELSSGPYRYIYWEEEDAEKTLEDRTVLYYKEGVTATVAVVKGEWMVSLVIDGKVDASTGPDMRTQILLAHLPLLLSEEPKRALVIGLASGVTLGSVERHPELENIDCVEISPEVIEASGFFTEQNRNALEDPRLTMIVHDARNFLKLSDQTYDVITSEPSNPWMSGSSALFTKEFFESCLSHLHEGGIMCQWVQTYDIPLHLMKGVISTFCEVFPHVSLWMSLKGDLIMLGSPAEFHFSPERVTARMSRPELRDDLGRTVVTRWQELLGTNAGGGPELCRAVSDAPLQTDDRPMLEFTLPRTLHSAWDVALENLKWLSTPLGGPGVLVDGDAESARELQVTVESFKDYLRGHVKEVEGDLDGALVSYEKALDGVLGGKYALGPMYLVLCKKGLEAERQEQAELAEEIYRRAIELAPNRGEAHYLLGVRLLETKHFEEALDELGEAVANDSLRVQPAVALAEALSLLGRHAEATQAASRAVRLGPGSPSAWYGAARVLARVGDLDRARFALERAVALAGAGLRARAEADSVLAEIAAQLPEPAQAGAPAEGTPQ